MVKIDFSIKKNRCFFRENYGFNSIRIKSKNRFLNEKFQNRARPDFLANSSESELLELDLKDFGTIHHTDLTPNFYTHLSVNLV